jgi:hypothetical protein
LHAKAKGNPSYRFYALYDKIYRADVLAEAWRRSRANGGASGVDGVEFEQIEREGVEQWLGKLGQELKEKRYEPGAVRRVMIPKANAMPGTLGTLATRFATALEAFDQRTPQNKRLEPAQLPDQGLTLLNQFCRGIGRAHFQTSYITGLKVSHFYASSILFAVVRTKS